MLAANEATWKTKVAKVYVIDAKNTSAAVEMFFERPEQFAPVQEGKQCPESNWPLSYWSFC